MNTSAFPRQHRETVHARRDRLKGQTRPDRPAKRIRVRFSYDLDRFVASAAHALRRELVYRTDGGKAARGLVLDSDPKGSFYRIYFDGRNKETYDWQEGQEVWLWALMHRKIAADPADRVVAFIEFEPFVTTKSFDGENLVVDPSERVNQIIEQAKNVAGGIAGDQGKRIRGYLSLAERQGYPKFLQLWFYDDAAIREFVMGSSDYQEELIRAGGGFPLEGRLPGNWQYPQTWRDYPFKDLLLRYSDTPPTATALKAIDERLAASIRALAEAPGGKGAGGERAVSPLVREFRRHLQELARDRSTLYYESDSNTEDNRSIFEF